MTDVQATDPRPDWARLYEQLGERVFRLLHRLTGDAALAEDLTHDTFVRVHEAGRQYDGRGELAAWVFRVAGNLGRDELRRRATRDRHLQLLPTPAPLSRDPDLAIVLADALNTLEPEARAVVLLHDVDGYTHTEIADMLDIAPGSSRSRLSRAHDQLRSIIGAPRERRSLS